MSTDIDNRELFLYYRQKQIEKKLLKSYAVKIATIISRLVVGNCNGCMIDHLFQTQHQCLMMERMNSYACTLTVLWKMFQKAMS